MKKIFVYFQSVGWHNFKIGFAVNAKKR